MDRAKSSRQLHRIKCNPPPAKGKMRYKKNRIENSFPLFLFPSYSSSSSSFLFPFSLLSHTSLMPRPSEIVYLNKSTSSLKYAAWNPSLHDLISFSPLLLPFLVYSLFSAASLTLSILFVWYWSTYSVAL